MPFWLNRTRVRRSISPRARRSSSGSPATPRCCARRSSSRAAMPRKRRSNSGYFLMPSPSTGGQGDLDGRSRAEDRRACRSTASRARPASTATRAASFTSPDRRTAHLLHARRRQDDAARRDDAAVADGRSPSIRRRAVRASITRSVDAAVDAAFADPAALTAAFVVLHKGRIVGERYMAGHHQGHAARELVDGEEPDGDALRAAGEGRRSTRSSSRRRCRSGRSRATRARRSASSICCA